MARVVKIATITQAAAGGNVAIPSGTHSGAGGRGGHTYILELTGVGAGSGWNLELQWVSPGGVATSLGTFSDATQTGTKAFTWAYAGTSGTAAPMANRFVSTLATSAIDTLAASLYMVTD